MAKHYRLSTGELRSLVTGKGFCVVSDLIVVEGEPVRYMYRDQPEDDQDSGWRFFAGTESDAYIDNPKNFSLLDVNVVANYDDTIVPLLDSPVGASFDKEDGVFYDASED